MTGLSGLNMTLSSFLLVISSLRLDEGSVENGVRRVLDPLSHQLCSGEGATGLDIKFDLELEYMPDSSSVRADP